MLLRCESAELPMSQLGQERRSAVRNISALPPRADVGADIVAPLGECHIPAIDPSIATQQKPITPCL
jgi:hypothetical protein